MKKPMIALAATMLFSSLSMACALQRLGTKSGDMLSKESKSTNAYYLAQTQAQKTGQAVKVTK
jgi:hypothetical protein